MRKRAFLFFTLLLILANVATAGPKNPASADTKKSPLPLTALADFTIPRGKILYERYCLFCHGTTGHGDGLNAFALPVKPADLTTRLQGKSVQQLRRIIRGGGTIQGLSAAMPSFGATLQEKYLPWLIDYLRHCNRSPGMGKRRISPEL